jgi:hypothetical protein
MRRLAIINDSFASGRAGLMLGPPPGAQALGRVVAAAPGVAGGSGYDVEAALEGSGGQGGTAGAPRQAP